jgi:hypothetical protein
MDEHEFDRLTRRFVLGSVAAALGLGTTPIPDGGTARKRKNKRVKRNEFGCVNVGNFCKHDDQCCSGICRGKKGKKKCRAHDADVCTSGHADAFCKPGSPIVGCITSTGRSGSCYTTTGNAGFCNWEFTCFSCTKDADCVLVCGTGGEGAACLLCEGCSEGTACGSPDVCP